MLWSRIDQKSCMKAIVTSGFELVVVPLIQVGDELQTDAAAIRFLDRRDAASAALQRAGEQAMRQTATGEEQREQAKHGGEVLEVVDACGRLRLVDLAGFDCRVK